MFWLTSNQSQEVPLPDVFTCRVCEKTKPIVNYSNKELKEYQTKKARNAGLGGFNAQLRCRDCSGKQVTELQCMGQCSEYKTLEHFSKAQRTRGAQWCQECVLWKEAAEPGVITAAAPVNELAPDEHVHGPNSGALYDAATYAGTELTETLSTGYESLIKTQTDSTMSAADFLHVPFHALNLGGSAVAGARSGHSGAGNTDTSQSTVANPPHLRHLKSVTSQAGATGYVPPHLRSSVAAPSVASSVSNPYENASTVGESTVINGPISGNCLTAIQFNGYDNIGKLHSQQRILSATTTQLASSAQASSSAAPPAPAVDRGNWARAQGTKRTVPQFPQSSRHAAPAPPAAPLKKVWHPKATEKKYYSDGESEDEM